MKIAIVIPCYNEETVLEKNIAQILFVVRALTYDIKIIISDNASKDRTGEIGKRLASENEMVEYTFVSEPGKGAAILDAWKLFDADIYGFMDADLSVDLSALKPALQSFNDGVDIVVASRRIKGSIVKRELYRKFTSFVLNLVIRALLKTKIRDTACGFKFFKSNVISKIVPGPAPL